MSKLYVNELAPKTAGNKIVMPQGGIIQHQYTMFTGTNSITCTTNTDTVLTDLTVNITPQSTSSVIKLEGQIFGEWSVVQSTWDGVSFFFRNSTKLGHSGGGNRTAGVGMFSTSYTNVDNGSTPEGSVFMYYDTPATTSTITYKIGILTSVAGNPTYHLNRTVVDTDTATTFERFISLISATEIAG